jgi:hypothetical protein
LDANIIFDGGARGPHLNDFFDRQENMGQYPANGPHSQFPNTHFINHNQYHQNHNNHLRSNSRGSPLIQTNIDLEIEIPKSRVNR